ncbi:MAG: hypothetical protein ACI88H_001705 [Cocleimonas sp.]|jgi:hypothetical protein
MQLAIIVLNIISIFISNISNISNISIFYLVHQKYPFEIGKQINTEQLSAIRGRFIIYSLLMVGISMLINFPILYWQG